MPRPNGVAGLPGPSECPGSSPSERARHRGRARRLVVPWSSASYSVVGWGRLAGDGADDAGFGGGLVSPVVGAPGADVGQAGRGYLQAGEVGGDLGLWSPGDGGGALVGGAQAVDQAGAGAGAGPGGDDQVAAGRQRGAQLGDGCVGFGRGEAYRIT